MEQPNEQEKEKKKVNDDLVVFMKKRSEHEVPRYTARLRQYVDFQRKRKRAATARRASEHSCAAENKNASPSAIRTRSGDVQKDKTENGGWFGKRGGDEKNARRSPSRSRSDDLSDACCRRRRRRRCCRRRRRRCSRRRRRRRCCCRRRRRSCRRRRRRRC